MCNYARKRILIKKFIEDNLPNIANADDVEKSFSEFWASERSETLKKLAEDENIEVEKIEKLIGEYLYTQKLPHEQDIADMLPAPPKILERRRIIDRVRNAIESIVDIFEW